MSEAQVSALRTLHALKRRGAELTLTSAGGATETVVAAEFRRSELADVRYAAESLVHEHERKLLIAGLDPDGEVLAFEPANGHTLVLEGATWALAGVTPLRHDGATAIAFVADARR